jgi:hypothetical protein
MATAIVSIRRSLPPAIPVFFDPIGARIKSRFRSPNLRLLDLTTVAAKAAPATNMWVPKWISAYNRKGSRFASSAIETAGGCKGF